MKIEKIGPTISLILTTMVIISGCASTSNGPDPATVQRVDPLSAPSTEPEEKGQISLARNFYFVFDGSGSMKDPPPRSDAGDQEFGSKIEGAKWAVKEFMKNVPKDVNLGLYVFDNGGEREVLPLGANNRLAFLADIEAVDAAGGTPLGDAIGKAADALVKEYKKQLGYGDYRLIVITDGEASDDINKGIVVAEKYNIPIYTIGFGIGQQHSLRQHSVSYKSADSAKEIKQALQEAAAELDVFEPSKFSTKQ